MYEEKRAECLRTQTEYKELEERYFNSKARSMEDVGRSLKVRCTRFCNSINNKFKNFKIKKKTQDATYYIEFNLRIQYFEHKSIGQPDL